MSENTTQTNESFQVPSEPTFDTLGMQGSMQQILQDNIGNYVSIDFLIGTTATETRQGLLYAVGSGFLVLYDDVNLYYVVCDVFAVKFVTFFLPGYRPGQVQSEDATAMASAPVLPASAKVIATGAPAPAGPPVTASQAAYAHVRQKTRR